MSESERSLIERLETRLRESFSAAGEGLEGSVRSLGSELPEDLRELLLNLDRASLDSSMTGAACLDFAFRCGQADERLRVLAQSKVAAELSPFAPDGTLTAELENNDLDAMTRFVAIRDRVLRTVADYTLKFLMVAVVLLIIGLSLGLI